MEFYAHFGLRKMPFTREVLVSEMYNHPQHEQVLSCLIRAVEQRMSAGLMGPAGYGKTSLIRAMRDRLPDVRYDVHYVKVSGLSKRDMCRVIAQSLHLAEAGTFPRLLRLVQESLEEGSQANGRRTVLILDDAHGIRPDVLGMFKALTNYDMDSKLVLSILLVGQPPLAKLLQHTKLLDVAQRLSWFGELRALSRDETLAYIAHRSKIAGANRSLFDERALEALYEMSRGNLRAIDHLSRRSLEVAHSEKSDVVGSNHVITARGTLRI